VGTVNATGPVRELVISQGHIHGRDLGRLLHPADGLQHGDLRVEVLEGDAAVHEERGVRVTGGDPVDADALLDELTSDAVDHAPQRRLGCDVGDRALDGDEARDRVGDDDGGARGQERGRGLDDVEVCVEVDLHDVVPYFWGHLGHGFDWTDGAIMVSSSLVPAGEKEAGHGDHTDSNLPSVADNQVQGSQLLVGRTNELLTEFRASQVPRDSDELVLDTRVLVQKVGQGSSVGLLLGKVVDGHFGSLPGDCDYKIGS